MGLLDNAKKTIKTAQKKAEIIQKEYEQNLKKSGGNILKAGYKTAQPYAERKYNEAKQNHQEAKNVVKNPQPLENKVFKTVYSTADKTLANANQKLKENIPIYNKTTKIPQTVQNIYNTGLSNSEELAKQGGAYGLINSIGKVGYDLTYPIAHPIQSIEGLGNMLTDPQGIGNQLADTVVNYIDPANDFQNIQADPTFIPRTVGEFMLGAKGLKSTPKTVITEVPKTEIPIANTKPLPVQPKVVAPKTKIPTVSGDKYAMAGRTQQVFPTNSSKANPSMGGFESVKRQVLPEEIPLSTEEMFSMVDPLSSTDIPLVKGLSDLMSGKEVNQNALKYMIDNEAKARGISPQQLVDELTQDISIVDEMPFGQSDALGLHNRMTGKIYLKDVDKGGYTHPENPDYTITNWNNTLHEGMHRSINKIIEAHNNGTLTPEGYEYAKRIGINLDNPLTEDLSHVMDSFEIENPYISNSRVDTYNGRLNASETERLRPIIRNDIADYVIKQELSPINSDLNYYIQDAFNKAGIRYTPNVYVGNDILGFN